MQASGKAGTLLRASVLKTQEGGEWSAIDFIYDKETADRFKLSGEKSGKKGYRRDMESAWHKSQAWLSAVCGGIVLGFIAVFIDACSSWVNNFRIGVCMNYFWLGRGLCCSYSATGTEECDAYYTWGEFMLGRNGREGQIVVLNYLAYVALATVFATTSAVLCKVYAPYAAGGGINEVKTIISGMQFQKYLGVWVGVIKGLGVCLSTGSGLVVGKEGPFVHIGSCVANAMANIFPNYRHEGKRRELIAAGGGAGVAVAFGAPIGGVLFALEEMSYFYSFKSLMQSLLFGVTGVLVIKSVDLWHTGRIVQFGIHYSHQWHWFELPMFFLCGLIGGLVGSFFNVFNIKMCAYRKKSDLKLWGTTEIAVIIFITATFNHFAPFCSGGMLELLAELYQDCPPGSKLEMCEMNQRDVMYYLLIAGTVKIFFCIISFGTKVPCGVLVPSLCIGALLGRAFGIFFQAVQTSFPDAFLFTECFNDKQCIVPGIYAIVTSAAVLTGVTRMTICLVVIMFELTGGLTYLVPCTIGIVMAKWVGDALGVESIYELGIELNKLPYLDPKKEFTRMATAADVCPFQISKLSVLSKTGWTIGRLNNMLDKNEFKGFPIVNSDTDYTLVGYITRKGLITAMHETAVVHANEVDENTLVRFSDELEEGMSAEGIDFSAFVDDSPLQVTPDCSVGRMLHFFKSLGCRLVVVTKNAKLRGMVTKKDLLEFMHEVEHEEMRTIAHAKQASHKPRS